MSLFVLTTFQLYARTLILYLLIPVATGDSRGPSLSSRRESIWIITEILELASNGSTTTLIARKLGLNYRAAQEYVERLLASGHLRKHLTTVNMLHELTEKGEQFLAGLKAIKRDADEVFNPPRRSTVLAEDQSGPYSPWRGSRPYRAPPETRQ